MISPKGASVSRGTGRLLDMTTELDILRRIDAGLEARALPYMLTGSFALARYTTPRMTRDIDIVVALKSEDVDKVAAEFSKDFYVDIDAAHAAVSSERLFNMMHQTTALKVDVIVLKSSEYRRVEFDGMIVELFVRTMRQLPNPIIEVATTSGSPRTN